MKDIRNKIKFLQLLFLSKKTSRKIIIIESDDWGSERIPNLEVRAELMKSGMDMVTNPHSRFDTLERLEDLEAFEYTCNKIYKEFDKKIRITTNFITSNPDFAKIRSTDYNRYHSELFTTTYKNRDGNSLVWEKLKHLKNEGFILPQFHGKEHINKNFWMEELQNESVNFLKAFELACYAIDLNSKHRKNLMASLEYETQSQKKSIEKSLIEGMLEFESTFGQVSTTFIPPRYVWNFEIEKTIEKLGVKSLQSSIYQLRPSADGYKKTFHFTGQQSKFSDLSFLVRNCYFEPSYSKEIDWVTNTLNKIRLAFLFKTPAIISMHRINFVGGLSEENRDINLKQFESLMAMLIKEYPEVEFLSSDELARFV